LARRQNVESGSEIVIDSRLDVDRRKPTVSLILAIALPFLLTGCNNRN
jgi:hypothetical protein